MALASRLRSTVNGSTDHPDPVVTDLPRLADDPEVVRLSELKSILCRARDAREALQQVRAIDAELQRGAGSQRGPRAELLRQRRTTLLASLPPPTEAQPASDDDISLHPDVILGLRLTRGGKLPEDPDRTGEAVRLQQEVNAINAAIRQVDLELDEVRADRSADIARDLWEQHKGILQSKFRAAMALCQASTAERALITAMIQAGYTMQPGILMSPRLDASEALGSLGRADSPINRYRQALELAGVL